MNCFSFAFALGLAISAVSSAGQRLALVVGNSDYEGAKLDLELISVERKLTEHGFKVVRRENLNAEEIKKASEEFVAAIPTNGIGLFYYAGLGANVDRNGTLLHKLRPVRESISNEGDYRKHGLDVAELGEHLEEESGSRLNLIVLEVPTESPIKPEDEKVKAGLVPFDVGPRSQLILNGEEFDAALEDLGAPSPYSLVPEIAEGKAAGEAYVNSVGMTFHWCPPGKFRMGMENPDPVESTDRQAVEVTLEQGYWLGVHEVTQLEYERVVRRTLPKEPGFFGKNLPWWGLTESKSVDQFCQKLNEREWTSGALPKNWSYVCPTEAEWEYACRAGSGKAYHFGDEIEKLGLYANFADLTLRKASPHCHWADRETTDGTGEALAEVGSFLPNAWGFHDMHGNVAEIVADHYTETLPGGTDPLFRAEKDGRAVIRGGAWCSVPAYCESSFRNVGPRKNKTNFVGFRIALKKLK